MKNSVSTIQKSVNNLEYIPRVLQTPFHVERIGYIQDKTELIDRCFILPSVLFIFEGRGILEENGTRMNLTAPFLIWNWPGEYKRYWPSPVWNELYIGFREGAETDLRNFFSPKFFRKGILTIPRPTDCIRHLTELLKAMNTPTLPGAADRIDQLAIQLLLEAVYPQQEEYLNRNEKIILSIAEYMQTQFRSDIDLNQLAEDHGWSYSTFQRQWRRKYSCSPIQYLRRLRNSEALYLLRESTLTIGDIAKELGFRNQFYFARFFRDMNHVSPSEFRMSQRAVAADRARHNPTEEARQFSAIDPFPREGDSAAGRGNAETDGVEV